MVDGVVAYVPEVSADWYEEIVEFADGTPGPVQWFVAHFTEGSILLLGGLLALAAWGRFGGGPRGRALALVAPLAVVAAYVTSEALKTVVDEERPCRDLTVAIVAGECPPVGDWSFPSNHATIAGALAAATLLLSRRWGWYAVPVAVLAAFSRTFVGVHYPHDVAAGVLLGAVVATGLTLLLSRPVADVLARRGTRPPAEPGTRSVRH